MHTHTAFALTADAAETFQGGVARLPDGSALDLAEALEEGDGQIVVHSGQTAKIEFLRSVPVLKEIPAPEGIEETIGYADRPYAELKAEAERRRFGKIERRKPDLAARLERHDAAIDAGNQELADAVVRNDEPDQTNDDQPAAGEEG